MLSCTLGGLIPPKIDIKVVSKPLHNSINIFHTVLYTFPETLTRRICSVIKRLVTLQCDSGVVLKGEI